MVALTRRPATSWGAFLFIGLSVSENEICLALDEPADWDHGCLLSGYICG